MILARFSFPCHWCRSSTNIFSSLGLEFPLQTLCSGSSFVFANRFCLYFLFFFFLKLEFPLQTPCSCSYFVFANRFFLFLLKNAVPPCSGPQDWPTGFFFIFVHLKNGVPHANTLLWLILRICQQVAT